MVLLLYAPSGNRILDKARTGHTPPHTRHPHRSAGDTPLQQRQGAADNQHRAIANRRGEITRLRAQRSCVTHSCGARAEGAAREVPQPAAWLSRIPTPAGDVGAAWRCSGGARPRQQHATAAHVLQQADAGPAEPREAQAEPWRPPTHRPSDHGECARLAASPARPSQALHAAHRGLPVCARAVYRRRAIAHGALPGIRVWCQLAVPLSTAPPPCPPPSLLPPFPRPLSLPAAPPPELLRLCGVHRRRPWAGTRRTRSRGWRRCRARS